MDNGPAEMAAGGHGPGGGGGMEAFHHAGGAMHWVGWMTIPILIFVLVGVALAAYAVWTLRRTGTPRGQETTTPTGPEAVLANRLATGEISADDYTQRIAVLRDNPPAGG